MQQSASDTQSGRAAALLVRLEALALAHPMLVLKPYERLEQQCMESRPAVALVALYGQFFVLERRGRAIELLERLGAGLELAKARHLPAHAALLHEALGRIRYQRGEYGEATLHWSSAVDLAGLVGHVRIGVAARIGLGQLHYALNDWETGQRFHANADEMLSEVGDDYLQSKLCINLGVGLFNRQQFAAAELQFRKGQAAAQRARHRDYQAEALWHLSRCAEALGLHEQATIDCRQALAMAVRCGYTWLQAVASATLAELASTDADHQQAIAVAEHSLQLAKTLGARRLQSSAHKALARLYQASQQLPQALDHLWQHQAVEAELYRLSLPERLGALARFDLGHQGAEERLLNLSNRHWAVDSPADLLSAADEIREQVLALMRVDRLLFWWDVDGTGRFSSADAPGQWLSPDSCPGYLTLLERMDGPLTLTDLRLHPCHAELQALSPGAKSRAELVIYQQQRPRAVLWLEHGHQARSWARADVLNASHVAKIYERLLLSLDLAQAKQAKAEMEREKIASLGRLVAGIAHDVNTPIGVAITAASCLGDAARRMATLIASGRIGRSELLSLSEQMGASGELVERNLQRAAALVGDFKRIAVDQNTEELQTFELGEYLRSVVAVHGPALRKSGARVELEVEAGLRMTLPPGLLTQVFSNLIMNSLTHAFPQGQGGCIRISAERLGGEARLHYRDDGVGVSAEVRARMFEAFFTTRRGQGGSGLGMYMVQNIVNRLGGGVELLPSERGLCLALSLPLSDGPTPVPA